MKTLSTLKRVETTSSVLVMVVMRALKVSVAYSYFWPRTFGLVLLASYFWPRTFGLVLLASYFWHSLNFYIGNQGYSGKRPSYICERCGKTKRYD
jgi:hypothetical protein